MPISTFAPGVALLLLAAPIAAQSPRLTAEAWRADLAWLDSTIRAVHPAPFHRVVEPEYARAVAALHRDIPSLDDARVAVRMMAIVALLHDGHSHMQGGAPAIDGTSAFPIRIDRFADGIRVVATRPSDERLLGARVERIGRLEAARAWDSLLTVVSGDNVFSKLSGAPQRLMIAGVARALGLAGDSLELALRLADGSAATVRLPAVAGPIDFRAVVSGWSGPAGATSTELARRGDAEFVNGRRTSAYWYAERHGMLYVQVNQVGDSRDSTWLGDRRAVVTFAEFTDRVMAKVDSGQVARLVLDLRFNGGGNNALARPFVAGIAARHAVNRRGRFFVITGRMTYSAAMNFTSMLEDRTEALFVGEAPGGAPRHYGDAVPLVLPRSRMTVRLSTLRWDTGVAPDDIRTVMEPDLPAPPRYDEIAAGIDAPLRAIARFDTTSTLTGAMLATYRASGLAAALAQYDSLHRAADLPDGSPWASDVQSVLDFAWSVIPAARAREDIFGAFAFVTDRYPASPVAWAARARVHAFINDWPAVRNAYARAVALAPADQLLRSLAAAAARRQ